MWNVGFEAEEEDDDALSPLLLLLVLVCEAEEGGEGLRALSDAERERDPTRVDEGVTAGGEAGCGAVWPVGDDGANDDDDAATACAEEVEWARRLEVGPILE
jgi:hypothetical protein